MIKPTGRSATYSVTFQIDVPEDVEIRNKTDLLDYAGIDPEDFGGKKVRVEEVLQPS